MVLIFQVMPRGILRPPSASFATLPPSPPEDSPDKKEASPRPEATRSPQPTPAVTARRRRVVRRSPSPSPPPRRAQPATRRPTPGCQAPRFPATDIRYRDGREMRPAMKAAVRMLAASCSGRRIRRTARSPASPGRALVPLRRAASPTPRTPPPAAQEAVQLQPEEAQEVQLAPEQQHAQGGDEAAQEPTRDGEGTASEAATSTGDGEGAAAEATTTAGPWVPR